MHEKWIFFLRLILQISLSALLNLLVFVKINFKLDDHKDKPRSELNQTKTPFGGKKKKEWKKKTLSK